MLPKESSRIFDADLGSTRLPLDQASTLPSRYYTSEQIYDLELERFFYDMWLCVGHVDRVPKNSDFFTVQVGDESVVIVRDQKGRLNALYNVCRHRGSRIVTEAEGNKLGLLQCPYHSWTYSLEGKLVGAPHMDAVKDFEKQDYSLVPIKIDTWDGFIFINLAENAESLASFLGDKRTQFERYHMVDLKLGRRMEYQVAANWKLLCENYSECYHCALIHPELNKITPYLSGKNEEPQGRWIGGWMEIVGDYNTLSMTGKTTRSYIPGISEEDKKRIYYYLIFPNLFLSPHPDYVMTHTVWPEDVNKSRVVCEWYFEKSEVERKGFDPSDAVEFWDLVNRQDWKACELTQQGLRSRGYRRGRYSLQEQLVHDFDKLIIDKLAE